MWNVYTKYVLFLEGAKFGISCDKFFGDKRLAISLVLQVLSIPTEGVSTLSTIKIISFNNFAVKLC